MTQIHGTDCGFQELRVPFEKLGVQWGVVAPFWETFGRDCSPSMVVSVDSRLGSVGLMAEGDGQSYIYRVAQFMEGVGVPEFGIQRVLARSKYFDAQRASFTMQADHRGVRECSTQFSSAIEIDVAHALLADAGVGVDGVGLMEAMAELLNQGTIHSIATRAATSGHLTESVCFELNEPETDWDSIRSAGVLCGLSDSDWAPLDAFRSSSSKCPAYASVQYRDGNVIPGLKLSFEDVYGELVGPILLDDGQREWVDSMRASLGRAAHRRVDFRLCPGIPVAVTTHNAV